jgi:predicted nucleic acid-binding protein
VIVVDASVVVKLIADRAPITTLPVLVSADTWAAPCHIDVEVLSALRRYVMLRKLTTQQADLAVDDYYQLSLERHGVDKLIWRIWQLRDNLSSYDGAYVALGETLGYPLVTCDAKLANSQHHKAKIILI